MRVGRRIGLILAASIAIGIAPGSAGSTSSHRAPAHVYAAIKTTFGGYTEQALRVSWCESRYSTRARNGQYLGLFQMGSSERRIFGHGDSAIAQARAAHRYFVASGRDWSPWSCKP